MPPFDYMRSIELLENRLSKQGFERIRVALSLLHYEHNLPLSEKSYLLALFMVRDKMEKSALPKNVAQNYGFHGPQGDHDIVQSEIEKGIQHIPRSELEAEITKFSESTENRS